MVGLVDMGDGVGGCILGGLKTPTEHTTATVMCANEFAHQLQ